MSGDGAFYGFFAGPAHRASAEPLPEQPTERAARAAETGPQGPQEDDVSDDLRPPATPPPGERMLSRETSGSDDPPTRAIAPLHVLVTGGTGFVGHHTARALAEAGHHVKLLVRDPAKMRRVFGPVGLGELPSVVGDITDAASVAKALDGCDAVVHAAAMVSVHEGDADRVLETNLRGVQLVLGGAFERGIERLLQVSSTTVFHRPDARYVDESSPLGHATRGYGGSKIACEEHVRGLQDLGAPIATTYPGSVIGPDDPGLSEAMVGLKGFLDTRIVPVMPSGIQLVDVRDVAEAHVRLLERGGADRVLLGGHYVPWSELVDLLEEVTMESFLGLPVPAPVVRAAGRALDWVDRFVRIGAPVSRESSDYATDWAVADDGHARRSLGLELRDLHTTLGDTIRWLGESGQLWWTYRV